MDTTPPAPHPSPLDRRDVLTRALVHHVRECFAAYPEVELSGPATGPPVQLPRGVPRLPVDVRDGRPPGGPPSGGGGRGVLVLCDCTDDPAPGRPVAPTAPGRPADVVEVRRASEIAGAVAESTAGDLPLVVDVRLSCADAERLLAPPTD